MKSLVYIILMSHQLAFLHHPLVHGKSSNLVHSCAWSHLGPMHDTYEFYTYYGRITLFILVGNLQFFWTPPWKEKKRRNSQRTSKPCHFKISCPCKPTLMWRKKKFRFWGLRIEENWWEIKRRNFQGRKYKISWWLRNAKKQRKKEEEKEKKKNPRKFPNCIHVHTRDVLRFACPMWGPSCVSICMIKSESQI